MRGIFLFLGTGSSTGVPVIGCKCSVCSSPSLKNRRLRSAGWIQVDGRSFLIDVGPDFRQQALTYGIDQVDGLLLTHTHYDHIAGIDDLRIFSVRSKKPIPCLLSYESYEDLKLRYFYFFKEGKSMTAQFACQQLPANEGQVSFLDLPIRYFSYSQGDMKVIGYRLGDFAYVSDIRDFSSAVFSHLEGVNHLVLSALRQESNPLHLSVGEAVDFAKRVGAKKTWLTHMSHSLDYEETNSHLPVEVQLAYDGQTIEFEMD